MAILIIDSRHIQAIILRICIGLVLTGLPVTAHTAQPVEGGFVPDQNIFMMRLTHADRLLTYQLDANVALTPPAVNASASSGLLNASPLHLDAHPKNEAARTTNSHWRQSYDNYLISLRRQMSVEFTFRDEQTHLSFQRRSVVIQSERLKITFQPQSALIESGAFKMLFQPRSASATWNKAF